MCFEGGDKIVISNLGLLTQLMRRFDEIASTIGRSRRDVSCYLVDSRSEASMQNSLFFV